MTQRSVLVTGCSSGIGRATASRLRDRGWRVFATARRGTDVERLSDEGFESCLLDLDDPASISAAVDHVLEASEGRIEALVNNAAFAVPGAVEDLTREALRRQFETNLFGTVELTNRIIPVMRAQKAGRIVMVSSILGLVAMPWRGAYNASKFALEGLTDTLRMELAGSGIHVALIEPGPVRSRFRENAIASADSHIDMDGSRHRERYARMREHAAAPDGRMAFSVSAAAIAGKITHALESGRPRIRYRATLPAHLLSRLKHVLPVSWLDRLLIRL